MLYDGNVEVSADSAVGTSLTGANLGAVAFQVTGVDTSGTDRPAVTVQVLDTRETCGEGLDAFSNAQSN